MVLLVRNFELIDYVQFKNEKNNNYEYNIMLEIKWYFYEAFVYITFVY